MIDDDPSPMSPEERAERLERIKARITAAIDDPRPRLTMEEFDAHLEEMIRETFPDADDEAA